MAERFAVVIPVHGEADLFAECVHGIAREARDVIGTLVVVDDASPKAEAERMYAAALETGLALRWLSHMKRTGFVGAANAGWAAVQHELVLLLNSDVIVSAGTLAVIHETLSRERQYAAVAAATDNRRDLFQYRAPDDPRHDVTTATYLTAACLGLRRSAVGAELFDTCFAPGYFEDLDLSCRLRVRGWRLAIAEAARVHHVGGATFSRTADWESVFARNHATFTERWGWLPSQTGLTEALDAARGIAAPMRAWT